MKKFCCITLVVFVASLLMAASPTPVGAPSSAVNPSVRLTITNQSDGKVYLRLQGDPNYYFTVPSSATKAFTTDRGEYSFELTACGQTTSGKMDLTIFRNLVVPACGAELQDYSNNHMVNLDSSFRPMPFTIANGNPKTVYVTLKGPKTYNFRVGGNTTSVYSVTNGKYTYTLSACETSVGGKIDLTKYQVMNIPVCGASASGSADEHQVYISFSNIVRANFTNHTSTGLAVLLKGPRGYSLYLPVGTTKTFSILRGNYSYEYFACGKTFKGKFEATNKTQIDLSCP